MSDNKCKACGQWSGKGHRCPMAGVPASARLEFQSQFPEFRNADGSAALTPEALAEVQDRVAAAKAAIQASNPTPPRRIPVDYITVDQALTDMNDPDIPFVRLSELSRHTSPIVRAAVARHANTDEWTHIRLAGDDNPNVLLAVAERSDVAEDIRMVALNGMAVDPAEPSSPQEAARARVAAIPPDYENSLSLTPPPGRPYMVEDFRNDRQWFFATKDEANTFAADLMASDPAMSGNVGSDGWDPR